MRAVSLIQQQSNGIRFNNRKKMKKPTSAVFVLTVINQKKIALDINVGNKMKGLDRRGSLIKLIPVRRASGMS